MGGWGSLACRDLRTLWCVTVLLSHLHEPYICFFSWVVNTSLLFSVLGLEFQLLFDVFLDQKSSRHLFKSHLRKVRLEMEIEEVERRR